MPSRVAALASCLLAVLVPARGVAQSAPAMVRSWEVPEGVACGTAESLDAEVARLLGGDPDGRRNHVRATGAIAPRDDGTFALTLAIVDVDGSALGSRVLTAGDCAPLAEAAALLVALAVDPGAVAEAGSEGQPPELPDTVVTEAGEALDSPAEVGDRGSESELGGRESELGGRESESASESESESDSGTPESELESPPEEPSTPSAPRRWPTRFGLDASLFLELGVLPAPAAGAGLGLRLERRRLRAGVGLAGLLPRQTTVTRDDGPDASARFFGLMARLELGGGFVRSIVHFDAAAILDVAVLGGSSNGVSDPDRGIGALALVGALARVLVRVGRVGIGVEADLRAATSRPSFEILGLGEAHRPNALVGRVGIVLRFPARP